MSDTINPERQELQLEECAVPEAIFAEPEVAEPEKDRLTAMLEELEGRYKRTNVRDGVQRDLTLDLLDESSALERLSHSPSSIPPARRSEAHLKLAKVHDELVDFSKKYGEIKSMFDDSVKKDELSYLGRLGKVAYKLTLNPSKKTAMIDEARKLKNKDLVGLVKEMQKIMTAAHNATKEGKDHALSIREKAYANIKNQNRKLVESIRGFTGAQMDVAAYEREKQQLQVELRRIDAFYDQFQLKITSAISSGNLAEAKELSEKVDRLLDLQNSLLDGDLNAESVISDARLELLRNTTRAKSARQSKQSLYALLDSANALYAGMAKEEMMFGNFLDSVLPVLELSAEIAVTAKAGAKLNNLFRDAMTSYHISLEAAVLYAKEFAGQAQTMLETETIDDQKVLGYRMDMQTFLEGMQERTDTLIADQQVILELKQQYDTRSVDNPDYGFDMSIPGLE